MKITENLDTLNTKLYRMKNGDYLEDEEKEKKEVYLTYKL
jgi:hypothetical protein